MTRFAKPPLPRHESRCRICADPRRAEIELDLVEWESPGRVAKKYTLSRAGLHRHMRAMGLFSKRARNVRFPLGKIIEKVASVKVTARDVIAAVTAFAKINAGGLWVERSETVSLNELFDKMSQTELEKYAVDGTLPGWFERTVASGRVRIPENSGREE